MATAITKNDVLDIAPELATGPRALTTNAWTDILAVVNEVTIVGDTDNMTHLARIYLAAHIGLMDQRANSGIAGPVTGETAGGLRRTYGTLNFSKTGAPWFNMTLYGQLYLSLLSMSSAHGPITV